MISSGDLAKAGLWVTGREGPYHCDPLDPGGATAWGVAIRYHPEFTDEQLRTLTQEQAAQIFVDKYWPSNASDLPSYLAIPLLSFSVLEGPLEAVETLQKALGVHVDGKIGQQTIHAASLPKPNTILEDFFRACMERLHNSPSWSRDGTGWECRQLAASLAAIS